MGVTVCSIMRDSAAYIPRYFDQIAALESAIGEPVDVIVGEGDSTDDTPKLLEICSWSRDLTVVDAAHGGPQFGSVDNVMRWSQIAYASNRTLEQIRAAGPVIWVESDLIWAPSTMVQLLEDLAVYGAVAPMSMCKGRFYDIWGHRGNDGTNFAPSPPYHSELGTSDDPCIPIHSAGSCIAMRNEVARTARFGELDAIVGFCRSIRYAAHTQLWLDRRVSVEHP